MKFSLQYHGSRTLCERSVWGRIINNRDRQWSWFASSPMPRVICLLTSGALEWRMPALTRQKITFAEMRAGGVRGLLIYCSDYHCSHWTTLSADRWPDDVRLSDISSRGLPVRLAAGAARTSGLIGNRLKRMPSPSGGAAILGAITGPFFCARTVTVSCLNPKLFTGPNRQLTLRLVKP